MSLSTSQQDASPSPPALGVSHPNVQVELGHGLVQSQDIRIEDIELSQHPGIDFSQDIGIEDIDFSQVQDIDLNWMLNNQAAC